VLLPVQIDFLELIIDPACFVVFEAEPEYSMVMKRSPRNPKAPPFERRTLLLGQSQGACAFMMALANRSHSRLLQSTSHARNATLRWIVGGPWYC
jgi:hypothetical protein